jgi:hypothetical protein
MLAAPEYTISFAEDHRHHIIILALRSIQPNKHTGLRFQEPKSFLDALRVNYHASRPSDQPTFKQKSSHFETGPSTDFR